MDDTVSVTHLLEAIRDRRDNGGGSASYQQACNHIIEAVQVLASTQPAPAYGEFGAPPATTPAWATLPAPAFPREEVERLQAALESTVSDCRLAQDALGNSPPQFDSVRKAFGIIKARAIAALLRGKQP